ncbi:hypothetical protein KAFR_0A04230 [Kazachstania africana CBS 2517]|uniref:Phosphoglycerate mutase n=1 Tax=Kazachstania africana (strain ATCC 22294 / BCRC 22015 / CBS 2517 / CECT 1963 / NBRC 1671 / NRRL Y-8276) TaxID=1071382 RepID=H2ANA8_KAZAF|nr:hypothetical protein KAFR_0A04230 [Kazachstania africana CBS 2517]CCF55858.1 hypothetical protein KAFR_0A04230 [Kazachstania africana CBS 2517]
MTVTKEFPFYETNTDPSVIRLFVIRHGQTEHNVLKILQGHKDISINSTGYKQAEKLGMYLKEHNIKFDKVFSSDLKRCQETNTEVLRFSGQEDVPVELDSDLRERFMGIIEGMHITDAEKYANKHGKGSFRDFGEDPEEFTARLHRGINKSIKESLEKDYRNIALISHGGAIRAILTSLEGPKTKNADKIIVFNTSVTIIDYIKSDNRLLIRRIGNTQHLGEGEFIVSDLRLR